MIVLCKKIGFKVEDLAREQDVVLIEDCEEKIDLKDEFVVFTCPAIYHSTRYENCEVLDLRVLKAFKKPEKVARAIIASERIRSNREIEVIRTGESVVYVGDNLEIIYDLSINCDLTVVTQKRETLEKLYPYEIRVVKGRVKDIKGKIGNFKVFIDGKDLVTGKRVDFLEAGQIIHPNWDGECEGIYKDEYRGAFKVLANLKSYLKLKTVEVDPDICGVMKSGFLGCNHCLNCPTDSISINKELEKIEISLESCEGCGFCSAICPISAIKNKLIPYDKLMKKIDSIASLSEEYDALAFVCKSALGRLNDLKDLPTVAPIIVPCINSISEVHYLYAILKGFRVVVIPCDCEKLRTDCFEIAKMTLKAFGFGGLEMSDWTNLKETVKKLRKEKLPDVKIGRISGENKRLQWLEIVEILMNYPVKNPVFETKYFGKISINQNCTLCNTCRNFCPSNAITVEKNRLVFTHALCIACELCVQVCPEKAIELKKMLDFNGLKETVVFQDEMVRCPRCGKEHISRKAYEKLKKITGMEKALLFCTECRPVVLLEGLYEEIVKELEEIKKRRIEHAGGDSEG